MPKKYDEQTWAKAVRLVQEHRDDYGSEYEAIKAIAGWLGMNPETVRKWLRQAEVRGRPGRRDDDRRGAGDPGAEAEERRAGANRRHSQGRDVFQRVRRVGPQHRSSVLSSPSIVLGSGSRRSAAC
jgi:transposase-like protein